MGLVFTAFLKDLPYGEDLIRYRPAVDEAGLITSHALMTDEAAVGDLNETEIRALPSWHFGFRAEEEQHVDNILSDMEELKKRDD